MVVASKPNSVAIDNDLEAIFFELANKIRLDILFKISKKPEKLTAISKELRLPMPEIHRNISRLLNSGLVERDSDGHYALTTFGFGIIEHVASFSFLTRYRDYFDTHTFGDLPSRYIQSIGALNQSEFIDGSIVGFDTSLNVLAKIIKSSERFLYMISPYTIESFTDLIYSHVTTTRIAFRYIFPENALVSRADLELAEKYKFNHMLSQKIVQRRMVKEVQVSLIVTEKEAAITFPVKKGIRVKGPEADIQRFFRGKNSSFIDWSLDYFEYRWNNSDMFSESKLRRL